METLDGLNNKIKNSKIIIFLEIVVIFIIVNIFVYNLRDLNILLGSRKYVSFAIIVLFIYVVLLLLLVTSIYRNYNYIKSLKKKINEVAPTEDEIYELPQII